MESDYYFQNEIFISYEIVLGNLFLLYNIISTFDIKNESVDAEIYFRYLISKR